MIKNIIRQIRYQYMRFNLRRNKVSFGKYLSGNACAIINKGKIVIGDRVQLNSWPHGEPFKVGLFAHLYNSEIIIGNDCCLNGTVVHCRNKVIIGNQCLFGPGVMLIDNDSHNLSTDPEIRRCGPIKDSPILVGDNVWIGMRSIVLKGVTIGHNSVIGAGSIVSTNIEANSVYTGINAVFKRALTEYRTNGST